jgi:hypothetical protein
MLLLILTKQNRKDNKKSHFFGAKIEIFAGFVGRMLIMGSTVTFIKKVI